MCTEIISDPTKLIRSCDREGLALSDFAVRNHMTSTVVKEFASDTLQRKNHQEPLTAEPSYDESNTATE